MAKNRKKKNYKLRRRVKRTIAAITMIMAIVVAAIPVENFGSMQAAEDGIEALALNSNFDIKEQYQNEMSGAGKYDAEYFEDNEAKPYDGAEVPIQQVDSNANVMDAYMAALSSNGNKAIASGKADADNIIINETEYYNYVMFNFTNESLDRDLGVNEISVTFEEGDSASFRFDTGKNQYLLDTDVEGTTAKTLDDITGVKRLLDTYKGIDIEPSSKAQNADVDDKSQGYDNKLVSKINTKELMENCEADAVEAYVSGDLKEYNDKIDEIDAIYKKVNAGPTTETVETTNPDDGTTSTTTVTKYPELTEKEVETWNDFRDNMTILYQDAAEFKIAQENFAAGKNGLKSVYNYIICQCFGKPSGQNLKNFDLVKGSHGNTPVYLPVLKSGLNAASGQYTDSGYLATDTTNIVGIRQRAFQGSSVASVETPASVTFIGAEAFEGCQNLANVSVNTDGCDLIGDSAFANSTLDTVTFSNTSSAAAPLKLGVNAFLNTKIKAVEIPASAINVEAGCFAQNHSLASVKFVAGGNSDVKIEQYAFYNCEALSELAFEDEGKQYEIAQGAFSIEKMPEGRDAALEFRFPAGNKSIDYNSNKCGYDYILAGRQKLKSVTFPSGMIGTIPANTLRGCYNLEKAVFETASLGYDSYVNGKVLDVQLFSDVRNDKFIVEGPAFSGGGDPALPRKSSWTGILGYMLDGEWAPVPYKYTDDEGDHIELGYRGGQYVAKIDIKEGTDTATLSKYTVNGTVQKVDERIPVTIPNEVGGYKIVAIGENCFEGEVKEKIYKIVIEDGYIETIGARAFEACKNLEWVYIGSPVKEIGESAFAGCERLENVEFSQIGKGIEFLGDEDEYWEENLKIGENAFNTQSEHLTFHGAIHSGYAPFELAMDPDLSNKMTSTGAHICYKSDEPKNLTVILNQATGKATLVDYPHYDEIDLINSEYIKEMYGKDYSIQEAFEDFYLNGEENDFKETDIVKGALNIDLPKGIESIDTATDKQAEKPDGTPAVDPGFYKNDSNSQDYFYVKNQYIFTEGNLSGDEKLYVATPLKSDIRNTTDLDITKLYSVDKYVSDSDYASDYSDETVARGGLFSGYFNEDGIKISRSIYETYADGDNRSGLIGNTYDGHEYVEDYDAGNDHITTVTMPTVDSLPDYAFDSCENLMTAGFGSELEHIGVLPFRNCKSMYSIDLGANAKYAFRNLILYRNKGDDTNTNYEIMELLEGRGMGGNYLSDSIVAEDVLTNVTSIAPSAFANNTNIRNVDLSTTQVIEIPTDCFRNDINLNKITFPTTIRQIDTGALIDVSDGVELVIPTGDCVITADAVDGTKNVFITGVKYKEDGSYSNLWHSYDTLSKSYGDKIHFTDYGNTYHIEFVDKDMKTVSSFPIEVKENETYDLEQRDIPEAPVVDGLEFQYWMCKVGDTVYEPSVNAGDPAFVDIKEDRLYYPYYKANPDNIVSEGEFKFEFENAEAMVGTKQLASGDNVAGGETIILRASDEKKFSYWSVVGTAEGDSANYTGNFQSAVTQPMITFRMPNADVKVTANLNGNGGSDNPGGDKPGGDNDDNKKKYKLTVNYGSGTGEYKAGETVTISAFAPDSSSKVFSKWTSNSTNLGFANATSSTTTIVMPESDVTVTANYKTRVGDDDDDDDDDDDRTPSRRPGTSTSTTTVTNRPSNSATTTTGTTGTVTNSTGTADNNGNKIYITKNGVSNKDVASITVDGSTDNFIVRISESAEATAAVEESLINKYGSLDGLAYFPMDISLYDSTGQNKITDTYGLNITVTMPIPDVLIQYGGNARVAACDNGNLQQLTPRFTTIDGIACISFVPPHFSPYVIYVDTNNLIAGQTLDQTPSTGDPIHPKWFLATGMACLSIILFATSDSRKKRNFKTA